VLVADFGIAAAADDTNLLDGGIAGTPEFMSPEQALGKQIDARSDLYGLGATAFYAFSGRFPFEGKSATEVLAKQVTEPPPPLASLGLAVPRKLASLVDRCLAKEPAHRPASAQALAEQLGVALEQRRELPAALRAFVKRDGKFNGAGTLLGGLALLPISMTAAQVLGIMAGYRLGLVAGYGTFFLGITAVPFAYCVYAARRLMTIGFAHGDIAPAFKAEIEQNNEELAVAQHGSSPTLKRVLTTLPKAFLGVFALSSAALVLGPRYVIQYASPLVTLSLGATFFATIAMLAFWQRHEDVDTEFWAKVWMGKIGKAAFSVARRLLGNRVRQSAMTHRATELSLGMAAEQLYDGLPKETRLALGDLPALLKRLQDDAQSLRKRHDELQEALGEAADAASPEYAEVRALRDSIHAKLGDAVGALETIRLNLLRLHAGSATVEGLTTHLGLAADVSEEVERLIAAHEEVERSLKFPRLPASTPV
jgi:serine/threonine-protein kinase